MLHSCDGGLQSGIGIEHQTIAHLAELFSSQCRCLAAMHYVDGMRTISTRRGITKLRLIRHRLDKQYACAGLGISSSTFESSFITFGRASIGATHDKRILAAPCITGSADLA